MDGNEWNPDAPDVGRDFAAAENPAPEPEHFEQIPGKIATKAELDMRKDARQEPALEQHLRIGGDVEQIAHQQEFDENERLIEYLEDRLNQTDLTQEFERSR
jgi:hypothetical protein